ncbi:hypothetical protein CEUSTIGMA_g2854.t1 [Chlamydomonas eustigma]|uniref:Uncharacterized protein n=1 Tax=Chlamydomonas eustigma TaxID=1157962 RepID=A0A250WY11_9CHLO|nr:hypothetical protein CEUSTIGMA_g2854.t1 [Chlamydomonas eustigma]|eukprot:GAX75410.1 hypothetical protein CEUSTIGMA_g2854.t1 [Chlamydomonas eustigma]
MTPYFFYTLLYVLIPTICFASTLKEYQELRFSDAYSIRLRTDVSLKEQQYAVELLVHATGFRITQPHLKDLYRLQNLGKRLGPVKTQGVALEGVEGVEVAEEGHVGGLRELAKVFQEGYGVDLHFNLSAALFSRAAQLGDSKAQAHMGQRHALGLASPRSWSPEGIRSFHQADEEQAILNYYFAAMGGNGMARMALGYRHLRGIGVPKSCWTAATYYQPVAEKVADLSTRPEALPLIERIRLHVQSAQGLQADRQREVVQYYQYSADKGNVDAQTAVAQVLNFGTYGVQRDHAQV